MMPSSGKMNVLNAASTRTGLAIQSTNSASLGNRPPNNANKQPTLVTSCLALLRQLQRGCFARVGDQAALAAGGWRFIAACLLSGFSSTPALHNASGA